MPRFVIHVAVALLLLVTSLKAQVASGPAAGSDAPALKVLAVTGVDADKEVDYSEKLKSQPMLILFIAADKFDRPVARFIKTIDTEIDKTRTDVAVVAVWITADQATTKDYLPRAEGSLKLAQTTLALHTADQFSPAGWNVDSDAHATAVLIQDGKVTSSTGYRSVNETDAADVLKGLKPRR